MWTADELLGALLRWGDDMPGNLIIGATNLEKFQQELLFPPSAVDVREREIIYPRLAESALHGEAAGSSAGGEQPKFTALLHDPLSAYRRVLVKFSPITNTVAGKRWGDLLTCEHLVLTVLQKNKIPAASASLIAAENRIFLEVTRFDRCGLHGRCGLFSLASFDAAYFGEANTPWTALAKRLVINQWVSPEDGRTLQLLWWFGTLIGNNDMHYGNVSLLQKEAGSLTLAPIYDMLPMLYAPAANGEIIQRPFRPPPPPPEEKGIWLEAATYAEEFWSLTQEQPNLDATFKSFAVENLRMISQLRTL
jgi:hypothetical protein